MTFENIFPAGPSAASPGELYMAFGPEHRVVKAARPSDGALCLVHIIKGEDKCWRQDCAARSYVDDESGDSLYQALRDVIDHCPALVELEP